MNREIGFRAWLKGRHGSINFGDDGFMDYDVTVQGGCWCDVESGWDIQGTHESVPLMQFSGLKDKNGADIYEGDLLAYVFDDGKSVGEVVFKGAGFIVEWKNAAWLSEKITAHLDIAVVIGNIYENPELLGGGDDQVD